MLAGERGRERGGVRGIFVYHRVRGWQRSGVYSSINELVHGLAKRLLGPWLHVSARTPQGSVHSRTSGRGTRREDRSSVEGGSSETSNMREGRRGEVRREAQSTTGGERTRLEKPSGNHLGEKISPATPNAASPVHHPHPPPPHSPTWLPAVYDLEIRLGVANPVQLRLRVRLRVANAVQL